MGDAARMGALHIMHSRFVPKICPVSSIRHAKHRFANELANLRTSAQANEQRTAVYHLERY
jgi:hypothetical protein